MNPSYRLISFAPRYDKNMAECASYTSIVTLTGDTHSIRLWSVTKCAQHDTEGQPSNLATTMYSY